MSAPLQFPDGIYDRTGPWWNNANDREMYDRAFGQDQRERKLEAMALICADVHTRNREIRSEMTAPLETPQFGAVKQEPTINDILAGRYTSSGNLYDRAPTDFSGTPAGSSSSSIPSLPAW